MSADPVIIKTRKFNRKPKKDPELEKLNPTSTNVVKEVSNGATGTTATVKDASSLPKPVVFCGPSGVGKGTLIEIMKKRFPNDQLGFSVSHTTRKPREGEVDGVHYNFSTVEKVREEIAQGKFIEYAEVHGNYYGTSIDAVAKVQNAGKICILDIDVQGVQKVKKSSLSPYYVFIAPPSMEVLEKRLRSRGTEKEEDIVKRLANAKQEMEYGMEEGNFDKIFVNDDLKKTAAEMTDYFHLAYPHLDYVAEEGAEPQSGICSAASCSIM